MTDRVGAFLAERTPRRALTIAAFLLLLVLFRQLLPLLVFFVAFERGLGAAAAFLAGRTRLPRKAAVLTVAGVVLLTVGGGIALGAGRVVRAVREARDLPERIGEIREHPWVKRLHEQVTDTDALVEQGKHYAGSALHYVSQVGHIVAYTIIGFIFAIVFHLERERLAAFREAIAPRSFLGTLLRWCGNVADAVSLTIQLQLVVAACNTLLTLPLLLLIGIPHVAMLMVLIFVSGLVPVIGNLASGAVLVFFAYQAKRWVGVSLMISLTFLLHKIESYYLNPHLTARHVPLPGFVLIVSLVIFEHLFGFAGLFLSFPALFVAGKIRSEFREEDEVEAAPGLPGGGSPTPSILTNRRARSPR
ncbi:AI-2E family transporter [Pendulispora albinea]|uniref:AI-2E family transporter n=1 Tax=Pendulispora albinea TaxID=2741071 RepID=A0ABZ2M8Q9_9BACT